MKWTTIVSLSLLLFSCEFEPDYKLVLANFDLSYENSYGEGSMELNYSPIEEDRNLDKLNFTIERKDPVMTFRIPGITYTFKEVPVMMKNLDKLNIDGVTFYTDLYTTRAYLNNYFQENAGETLRIDNFDLFCSGKKTSRSTKSHFLENCFKQADIKLNLYEGSDGFQMQNASINMRNHNFQLETRIDTGSISGKVKANGSMDYQAEDDILRIRVDKVKFGALSLTSRFFKEVKKNEREGFKVEKPYLYITLH